MVLGVENDAAQGLKAKEPSCVEKVQYLQTGFANAGFLCMYYTILSYLIYEVNEVHVLLYMAMTPVSNVQVQNCNNRVSWCTL